MTSPRSSLHACSLSEIDQQISSNTYDKVIQNNTIEATFLVDEKININLSRFFKNQKCVLTFLSTIPEENGQIMWKSADQNDFYVLKIIDDVHTICQNFISSEMRNDRSAILPNSPINDFFNIEDLGTENGYNLLFLSVLNCQHEDVEKLCMYNFEIDQSFEVDDGDGQIKVSSAIDEAWEIFVGSKKKSFKNDSNNIILSLLNANSKLPKRFDKSKASSEMHDFVQVAEILHGFVDSKNLCSLEDGIKKYPNLWYFYDKNNQSLMARALKTADLDTFKLLSSLNLPIGPHELIDHEQLYKNLKDQDKKAIRDHNQLNAKEFPATYIYKLFSKCKIANYNREHHIYQWKILEALNIIDSDYGYPDSSKTKNGRSKVLKIVAAHKKVKIIFDFDHDSNYYFDPVTSIYTRGTVYTSGVIEIGAKDLMDEQKKFGVIGTLIHELCHLAISVTYMNGFNPYQTGESDEKKRFEEIVRPECEKKQKLEEIIGLVFDNYDEDKINYELIVRPYHMMMQYFRKQRKINNCRKKYEELFSYLENVVEKGFDELLEIWEKLQDDDQNIKFCQLTKSMKAKILHEKIYFQGAKTSLFKIIGNNEIIFNLMTSFNIKNILFDKRDFYFSDICGITSKYDFIERKFAAHKYHNNVQISQKNYLNFKTIKKHVNDSKLFILTGKAGEGKSTIFERYCKRLKNDYILKNYWISCLKLKKNQSILNKFSTLNYDKNIDKISELICNILLPKTQVENFNFNTNFDVRIFKELFKSGKAILFFDGIDEISPELNEFILNVLKTIKEYTNNQIWISTRPQYAVQIRNVFNTDLFTLEPYNYDDRKNMIKNIARSLKINSHISSVINFFTEKFKTIYNPFLIEIIIELYEDDKTLIHTNMGQMFKNMIYAQFKKMDSKIDSKDRFIFDDFNFLYQVLALKFLFKESEIKHLSIIEKWEIEKGNWTIDKMQRYGYVTVYQEFLETGDTNSIDFIHFLYAEYFVSFYIYENMFDKNKNDKDYKNIFTILSTKLMINSSILKSFFGKNIEIKNQKLPDKIKELIIRKVEIILKLNPQKYLEQLKYWTIFLKNEHEVLKELRDKKVEICESEIMSKINELYINKNTLKLLQYILIEWGEDYNEKLKMYLKKLEVDIKKNDERCSKLEPNIKWFNESKEKIYLLTLVKDVKTYIEYIFEKYKKNTSLKKLRENFGFPSISLFLFSNDTSLMNLLTSRPKELQFFTTVINKFVDIETIDQNYENFKNIVIDLQLTSVKQFSVRNDFVDKLLEKELFIKILRDYCSSKSCKKVFTTHIFNFQYFFIYLNIFKQNIIWIEPALNESFVFKKPIRIKQKKIKKNMNWKRKM